MSNGSPAGRQLILALFFLLLVFLILAPVTAKPLTANRHIFINVANDAGVKFNLDGAKYGGPSNTYYIKADGGGLNELHITNNVNDAYGQVSTTTDQSGEFWVTNTGGRGFDNDIILLVAVKEPVADDFSVRITSSGYTWTPAPSGAYTPTPPTDYTYVASGVAETFSITDFTYGPQNWKPGPGALGDMTLPVFNGEDMADSTNQFRLMFIDLNVGNMFPAKFPGATLTDNGAVKIMYSFTNLHTFASFNGYGWCSAANQDQGISWTNPTRGFVSNNPDKKQSGQSGFSVIGSASSSSSSAPGGSVAYGNGPVLPVQGSAVPADSDLYGYKGQVLNTVKTGIVNGSVLLFFDPDAGPVVVFNRPRDVNLSVNVPPGSNITLARLYLYISDSQYIQGGRGIIPSVSTRLNSTFLTPDRMYYDADRDDKNQVEATCAYDVRELITGNGTYTFSLRNTDQDQSVFTLDKALLVTAYENANGTNTRYWINEGCDVILSQPQVGLFPEDAETRYPFSGTVNMTTARNASLYLVSTGLDYNTSTEHTVGFNDKLWANIMDNGSIRDNQSIFAAARVFDTGSAFKNNSTFGVTHLQVGDPLNETENVATVQSSIRTQDADYIVNRNAFLTVELDDSGSSASNTTTSAYDQGAMPADTPDPPSMPDENRCCRVTVDSDPEGALIYVDGTYTGKTTPGTLDVRKGETHTVGFELDGYSTSDVQFVAMNSTTIRPSLYAPVHSTKNRLSEEPEDPDGTRYGGLYIHSRPHSATISLNGVSTGKTAPALFMGLEPGSYTVSLGKLQDITSSDPNEFVFVDQTVWVLPDEITPVDINGIGNHLYSDIIVDSRRYRGQPFTVNGMVNNKTIPARIHAPLFNSFITIHENESYVSYPLPVPYVWDNDRYLLFEPRDHQNLSIAVDSSPRGAEIFIDGFRTGFATPYTLTNISDGAHWIMATKNGYLPRQSSVYLPRSTYPIDTTFIDFDLEEYPSGFLYVDSIPQGGRVSIDNMYTGEIAPALFRTIPTGAHKVEVKGKNSSKTFYDVTVNSVYLTNRTADFTPHDDD